MITVYSDLYSDENLVYVIVLCEESETIIITIMVGIILGPTQETMLDAIVLFYNNSKST